LLELFVNSLGSKNEQKLRRSSYYFTSK